MSSESPETAAVVRRAVEVLKLALDDHLAEVEHRSGEQDPAVQDAYERLRNAAQVYDDALFDGYDEVTPFTFAESPKSEPVEVGQDHPHRLSLLLRVDVQVEDVAALLDAARLARHAGATEIGAAAVGDDEEGDGEPGDRKAVLEAHVGAAVGALVDAHGVDSLREEPEEFGLVGLGSTLWVVDAIGGDLQDKPFDGVDAEALLLRDDEVYV